MLSATIKILYHTPPNIIPDLIYFYLLLCIFFIPLAIYIIVQPGDMLDLFPTGFYRWLSQLSGTQRERRVELQSLVSSSRF